MPRILHHINDIDQQLASRRDLKVQLLILIRLLHHHQGRYGQLEPLQTLCTLAKTKAARLTPHRKGWSKPSSRKLHL